MSELNPNWHHTYTITPATAAPPGDPGRTAPPHPQPAAAEAHIRRGGRREYRCADAE